MNRTALSILSAAAFLAAAPALAQVVTPEVEPDSYKGDATYIICMTNGDSFTGTTLGATVAAADATPGSADYFLVRTCGLPLGIYQHTLTLTTTTPGHTTQIRGLSQAGIVGFGGKPVLGTDVAAQSPTAGTLDWYGFGKSERLYVSVKGTAATTALYTQTLTTSPVAPTILAGLTPGPITISSVGMGHVTDTEFWVYNANFGAIPGYGNDDTPPPPAAVSQSTLTRFFAAGVYYLAVSTYNLANDQPSPGDDNFVGGTVLDLPDGILTTSVGGGVPVDFTITDAMGATPVLVSVFATHEVLWFELIVGAPGAPFCIPGAGGVAACVCGNPNGPGRGCANTGSAGGTLVAVGFASLAADALDPGSVVLTGSSMLSGGSCIFLQGDALLFPGFPFGAGIRCSGGQLFRLKTAFIVAGSASYPGPGDRSISNRASDLGTPIIPGSTRWYQTYYRDPGQANPGPPCPATDTFNVTMGQFIPWAP